MATPSEGLAACRSRRSRPSADALAALPSGAEDFLVIPDDLERLAVEVRKRPDAGADRAVLAGDVPVLAGQSRAIAAIRDSVRALAPLHIPVLVQGEAGSGHDDLVEALHVASPGRGAITRIPCGGQGDATVPHARAVHLIGVERLSAAGQRAWRIALACDSGRRARRAPRVFASSSADLLREAREGRFDTELARQLSRFVIVIPPLRRRLDDLGDIAHALARRVGLRIGRPGARMLPSAIAALRQRAWPGNLDELAEVLERAIAFSSDGRVDAESLLLPHGVGSPLQALRQGRVWQQRDELRQLIERCDGNLAEVARHLKMSRSAVFYRARRLGLLEPVRG